jgi:hypothetical protein
MIKARCNFAYFRRDPKELLFTCFGTVKNTFSVKINKLETNFPAKITTSN